MVAFEAGSLSELTLIRSIVLFFSEGPFHFSVIVPFSVDLLKLISGCWILILLISRCGRRAEFFTAESCFDNLIFANGFNISMLSSLVAWCMIEYISGVNDTWGILMLTESRA